MNSQQQRLLLFLFNRTPLTFIYTLSLHDALPISPRISTLCYSSRGQVVGLRNKIVEQGAAPNRSEEHTSELQSHSDLVCRLLLEKKKISNEVQRRPLVG